MRFVVPSGDLAARDRPDASVPPTAHLVAGTEVTEIERRGVWMLIAVPDGRRFWVDGRRLAVVEADRGAPASVVPLPPEPVVTSATPGPTVSSSGVTGAEPRRGALARPWLLAAAAIAVVAAATSVVMLMRSEETGATTASTSTLRTTTTSGTTTAAEATTTIAITTTTVATTTTTLPAILGSGTKEDPFLLPYSETFGPPVDGRWMEEPLEGAWFGEWTWDVATDELVATARNSETTLPRSPWLPYFDLSGVHTIEAQIEVARATADAACGLALAHDDAVTAILIDPADGRYLVWAPVGGGGEPAWTPETSIRTGANEVTVAINGPESVERDVFSIYLNGEKAIDVTGWYGPLGPVTGIVPVAQLVPGTVVGECRFDDFSVTRQTSGSEQ
jgi:hypothetical protein